MPERNQLDMEFFILMGHYANPHGYGNSTLYEPLLRVYKKHGLDAIKKIIEKYPDSRKLIEYYNHSGDAGLEEIIAE